MKYVMGISCKLMLIKRANVAIFNKIRCNELSVRNFWGFLGFY